MGAGSHYFESGTWRGESTVTTYSIKLSAVKLRTLVLSELHGLFSRLPQY